MARQHCARRSTQAVDVRLGVRQGEEHRLELRRRKVYALREHPVEEARKGSGVGSARVAVVAHPLDTEEEREHGADAADASGRPGGRERLPEHLLCPGAETLEAIV